MGLFHSSFIVNTAPFLLLIVFQVNGSLKFPSREPPVKLPSADSILFLLPRQNLTLRCPVESKGQTYIDWYKGKRSLYMDSDYEISDDGILKLRAVYKRHQGLYCCLATNGYGTTQVNITVIVDDPESIMKKKGFAHHNLASRVVYKTPNITKPSKTNFTQEENLNLQLTCLAGGQPRPRIFWLKDGELLHSGRSRSMRGRTISSIRLWQLTPADAGVYKCVARNLVGKAELSYVVNVTAPLSPPKVISIEPSKVTVAEHSVAVIWCEVQSRPQHKLYIRWLKEVIEDGANDTIPNLFKSGKIHFRHLNSTVKTSSEDGRFKSKLQILNVGLKDSGTYVCIALDDSGYSFKNVSLTVVTRAHTETRPPPHKMDDVSLATTILIIIIVVIAVIVLITYLCHRNKSLSKAGSNRTATLQIECESFRQKGCGGIKRNVCPGLTHGGCGSLRRSGCVSYERSRCESIRMSGCESIRPSTSSPSRHACGASVHENPFRHTNLGEEPVCDFIHHENIPPTHTQMKTFVH